ncbi:MAG: hypothetical protein IPM16_19655 [Chloroflexi bacterium]|nr:hypothetical protein [Chloroflexota bacterium]
MFALILSLLFVLMQGPPTSTGWLEVSLVHDGMTRRAPLFVPSVLSDPAPLVVALHPAGTSPEQMAIITGFAQLASQSGWLVVFPEGPNGYWDYGAGTPEWEVLDDVRDDPGYLAALIESIAEVYTVDRSRIYAVGFSNGARMAYRLACDLQLAGAAMVAASISDEVTAICSEDVVSIFMLHGTEDTITPFDGKDLYVGDLRISHALSIPETAQFFGRRNGCANPERELVFTSNTARVEINRVRYPDCTDGATVDAYVVVGGGHVWAPAAGFETSVLIWEFLAAHARPVPEADDESGD